MPFYAEVRKTDQMVVATTSMTAAQFANFPADADVSLIEITETQYDNIRNNFKYHGSDIFKFRWDGTKFVSNPDTRPVVTFTPTEVKAELGEVVTVEIAHSNAGTGLREFSLAGLPIRMDFVDGKATVTIDTDQPGEFSIGNTTKFRVSAPLQVTVFTRKLGRVN